MSICEWNDGKRFGFFHNTYDSWVALAFKDFALRPLVKELRNVGVEVALQESVEWNELMLGQGYVQRMVLSMDCD